MQNIDSTRSLARAGLRGLMVAALGLALAAPASACSTGSRIHVPEGLGPDAPLVVALHGCTQTAAEFEVESGWSTLADRHGFVVLYPEQPTCQNQFRCWSWFDPAEITRGQGEIAEIMELVNATRAERSIDPERVYVAGFSAGGAMTVALLASYPEVFQAGSVAAGMPYKIADGPHDAFPSMLIGKDKSPAAWAAKVRDEHPGYEGGYPRTVFFHGAQDRVVNPVNTRELVDQWTALHGIDQTPDASDEVSGHARDTYLDAEGQARIRTYRFATMGHALPVDPGEGPAQGGQVAKYAKDMDLLAAHESLVFFGLVPGDS